jgi:predicted nucleic-acid-binding Zn-ribbon protein
LHKVQHNQRLKDRKVDVDVFGIDYGLCLENKINFYTSSKEKRQDRDYMQPRFFYENIAVKYDSDFIKTSIFKCGKCGNNIIYSENDLRLPSGILMKICPIHQEQQLIEVKQNLKEKIETYTEEEEKIIGLLANIKSEESIKANQIQKELGVSPYKIAWFIKKIEEEKGFLKRIKTTTPYQYYGDLNDE